MNMIWLPPISAAAPTRRDYLVSKSCLTVTFTGHEQAELLETANSSERTGARRSGRTHALHPDQRRHGTEWCVSRQTFSTAYRVTPPFLKSSRWAAGLRPCRSRTAALLWARIAPISTATLQDSLPVPGSIIACGALSTFDGRDDGHTHDHAAPARTGARHRAWPRRPSGILHQIFQACGYQVIAVDPDADRQAIMRQVGIRHIRAGVPLDDPSVLGKVALHVECSGHEQATLDGCKALQKGGEMSQVAAPWSKRTAIDAHELLRLIFFNYLTVRSSGMGTAAAPKPPPSAPTAFGVACRPRWIGWLRSGWSLTNVYNLVEPAQCAGCFSRLVAPTHRRLVRSSIGASCRAT